jgi:trehalose synthase-fused probable maltokinase
VTATHDAPIAVALARLSTEDLLSFLARQRWFASKGAAPTAARIASLAIMPWGDGAFGVVRVGVASGGAEVAYQLILAAKSAPTASVPAAAIIVRASDGFALYDAAHDVEFRTGLANALAVGAVVADAGGGRWIAEPTHPGRFTAPDTLPTRIVSAEQSNTSIIIGDVAIYKLFRTLKSGVHPDVEVTRFLTTRAGFAHTPALLATTRIEDGDGVTTSGMLQTFLPGSADAWSYALEQGRPYFAAPRGRDVPITFLGDATRLGAVTRGMHDALASDDDDPDFAPDAVTPQDVDRWVERTRTSARDALALLERTIASGAVTGQRLAEAQALVRRRDHLLGWIGEIDDALGDDLGMQTRTHGDYHLGQVLRSRDGDFSIIDFEGEPSRSLAERRKKTSPLRDVAGMLRSIAYAAATLAASVEKTIDVPTRELRSARWERDVSAAYLAGYLGDLDDDAPDILPEVVDNVHRLIGLFEAEKAFYELAYELNNRPEWAWIPMRGISKLFMKR